jgi:hypothetical protein
MIVSPELVFQLLPADWHREDTTICRVQTVDICDITYGSGQRIASANR